MAKPRANIVQVEFFHVGGDTAPSIEALLEECYERTSEGLELILSGHEERSQIKTVVRFFDDTGEFTTIALRAKTLMKRDGELFDEIINSNGLRYWWLSIQFRRLARQQNELRERVKALAVIRLRKAIKNSRDVAVQRFDHRFRLIRGNEKHELIESAAKSKSVWLFVFQPNDLLADTNVSVAYAM